ncbi:MAG: S9 family peptidase [Acidobacteria bacterium]|nr:S9 family peptidase [Acidobacteriota bacterium]
MSVSPSSRICLFALSSLIWMGLALATETAATPVPAWLQLGPLPHPAPAFAAEDGTEWPFDRQLDFPALPLDRLIPATDAGVQWLPGEVSRWSEHDSSEWSGTPAEGSVVCLATYLKVGRWLEAPLVVQCSHPVRVYLDGVKAAERPKPDDSGPVTVPLKLEPGQHRLLIKSVPAADAATAWTISAGLTLPDYAAPADLAFSLVPERPLSIPDILDRPAITMARISADGAFAAVSYRRMIPGTDQSESWTEILALPEGDTRTVIRTGRPLSGFQWAPAGHAFAYTAPVNKGTTTLFTGDMDSGRIDPLLENQQEFDGFEWSPNGDWILFSRTRKSDPPPEHVKRIRDIPDRWSTWRDRSFLYSVTVPDGIVRRLTAGELSTDAAAIHPDGRRLLFTRTTVDYEHRPYAGTELYTLDLATLESERLWSGAWYSGCAWSPEGDKLLVLGGPAMFGDLGVNIPDGRVPNDFDTQLYLFDPAGGETRALSRDFDPSITGGVWHRPDGQVYLSAIDGSYVRLFRFDPASGEYTPISTMMDVVNQFDVAAGAAWAVYHGSSAAAPPALYLLNLATGESRLLREPATADFAHVRLGEVRDWSFVNERGATVHGRVHLPPDFDPQKKYPCIVYYYGGTSPVTRDFGGRYPKNWYAAQGYVVYVLQPSGTYGYGQEFSAWHVNDWGKIVADEIIDGTKQFLAAHPFVDPQRVGCMGASYGGFMTMLLQTRTDIFAAAISHAGISSIASYWGEGWWGYTYNAVSAAGSFPWNRPDIYIDQSALFHADKIRTPLLLLHGSADTNVPPGESAQLYIALKLLGREVEFIEVLGEDHWVLDYTKRIIWYKTIIAWFDRWLKDQPQYWEDLYGDK